MAVRPARNRSTSVVTLRAQKRFKVAAAPVCWFVPERLPAQLRRLGAALRLVKQDICVSQAEACDRYVGPPSGAARPIFPRASRKIGRFMKSPADGRVAYDLL